MDIDGPTDEVQLADYQEIFPTFWQHPAVIGITLWGWRPGMWRTDQMAYLVNNDGSIRPALTWLRDYAENYVNDIPRANDKNNGLPTTFNLYNNYPNPFNPTTQIKYSVPRTGYISLTVYNLLGEVVATLYDGVQQPGNYRVLFDGVGLASGVYLYQLRSDNFVETKKLILLR
jgi:endo-1,4-beta-xylanase